MNKISALNSRNRFVPNHILCIAIFTFALLLLCGRPAHAAAKPKISAKKISVTVGKSKTVKVTHAKKVKWKILSGKKYIKVKKGKKSIKIIGKAAGTAKIQAKAGKVTLKCKVTVKKAKKKEEEKKDPEEGDKTDNSPISASIGDFSFQLLRGLHADGDKNVLISPDSILSALSMAAAGAKGQTLAEMNTAMCTEDNAALAEYLCGVHTRLGKSEQIKYKVADSIWTNKGMLQVKEDFIEKNKKNFGAEVYNVPFDNNAVKQINSWVSENTDQMIPSIIDELSADLRLILINAICFKGSWATPYYDGQISKESFTAWDGNKVNVQMLNESVRGSYYMELAGGRGFVKYYTDPQTAFFAFLPPQGENMDTYLGKLSGTAFKQAYDNRMKRILITKLPVFTFDYSKSLVNPLKARGMKTAFTEAADFSLISDTPLFVDEVIHKTHIEVDQNGTKAAAVTAILDKAGAAFDPEELKKEEVFLDRPFVYGIMDTRTGIPLFVGVADKISAK